MIEIHNLKKRFGSNIVLDGVDLKIQKGEVIAIIGPSGTGKSTLLRCLNRLEKPEEGSRRYTYSHTRDCGYRYRYGCSVPDAHSYSGNHSCTDSDAHSGAYTDPNSDARSHTGPHADSGARTRLTGCDQEPDG